jgi:tetratricopeptide (TPR) repeat protein
MCLLPVLSLACGSQKEAARSAPSTAETRESGTATLPPAALPDLSRMEPAVQQQLQERYGALSALIENKGSVADLARAYGEMGSLLLAAEYFEAAEPFYLHAQALQPDDMRWPYYLGHVYMATTQPDKAIDSFRRALRVRPGDVAALVWLGNVYLDQGQADLAEPQFTQALSIQPRTVSALFGLGQAALAKREYRRAADFFEQVLSTDPRASIAHYPLALAYRGLGDTAKAEAHLRQQGSVEIGPPDPLMQEVRGLLHGAVAEEERGVRAMNGGDFSAAAGHFRNAVALAPDNPSVRHELGTALSLTGDTRGALEQFQETLRRSPRFPQAHYSLGVLLITSGQYREAVTHFSDAVRYEPNYVEARLQLANTLARLGQLERSRDQFRQVLAIDAGQADAEFGYAMTLAGLRRYGEARAALSEGARRHPEQPRFAEALAQLQRAP